MLQIELKINGHHIARANVRNCSNLADVSDYQFFSRTEPSTITASGVIETLGEIKDHNRITTVWELVAKVAAEIADAESNQSDLPISINGVTNGK